jgi:phage terminase small subunit
MNLLPQTQKKKELTVQQEQFLELLFENGGNVRQAAELAGYSSGSIAWLKERLADEIVERTKTMLASQSLQAANKLANLVTAVDIERGDDLRLRAAESILNRVGIAKQETMNHNVQAIHGVVLLPPKKETIIEG